MISRYASLRQGLVGAWCPSLGASGFRLIDRSGYGNHGTLTNMDPGTDWVVSGGKGALDFDGTDDIVTAMALRPSFPMSVSWWAKYNSVINESSAVQFKTASGIDYVFTVLSFGDNKTYFFTDSVNESNNVSILTSARPSVTGWINICVVFSSSTSVRVYWNGAVLLSTTVSGVGSITPTGLQIGRRTGAATGSVNGALDDIRIYNRALSPTEIQLLYTGGRGVGLIPERIKHRRKTTAAATNRRRRILIGASQ
jgi:hypothetical protein